MAKLIEITGKAMSGEWGDDDASGNGIPVLRTTNFTNIGVIDFSNVVTRSIKRANISNKFLRNGDIIIEKSGGSDKQPVGRVVYFEAEEKKYLFNNFTGLLRVIDDSVCYSKYLFYVLFNNYNIGGTIPYQNKTTGLHNLKTDDYVKKVEIPLPPLETQKQIAANLDKVTHTINLCNEILEKLDLLVKSRFVEMFGDPVLNNKNWLQVTVGDLCFVTKLAGFEYTDYIHYQDTGDVIMIRGLNVKDKKLKLDDIYYIDSSVSDMLPRSQLKENDIVMTYVGVNIGDVALVDGKHRYHLAPNVAKISLNNLDKLNPVFFVNLLAFNKENFASNATNTAKQALNMDKIRKLQIMLPTLDLQTQFADFVTQTDKSKLAVKHVLEKAETLKKALMQEYFG